MISTQYPDRLLTGQELQALIPYSRTHIHRLEKAGCFPPRVQIGPNRVAWSQKEVERWIEDRKNERPFGSSQEGED